MKTFLFWFFAVLITVSAAIYQRLTGPTHPMRTTFTVNGVDYNQRLVRSLALDEEPLVKIKLSDTTAQAKIYFKRYLTLDDYQSADFIKSKNPNELIVQVPQQPAAGKIEYYIEITDQSGVQTYLKESPVVIRFKGGVPSFILAPHVLFMFIAMLFSNLSGLLAVFKVPAYRKYTFWTFGFLLIGGMILGPVVQLYAFGDLWTGVPFGWDLTDNKTLIAFLFWVVAVVMNSKKERPIYTVIASIVLLLIYSIPHSMFGSHLDYNTGTVTQGMIMNLLVF